jgi:hypothetical protein
VSTQLTRRTFLGMASAIAIGTVANRRAKAQDGWSLTADVIAVTRGLGLYVTFTVDFLDDVPLYIEVVDFDSSSIFELWTPISDVTGDELLEFGPNDIPYGRSYLVSIVDYLGQRQLLSPVIQVDAPLQPDILG